MSEPESPSTTAIPRAGAPGYLRIATEEAFATRALFDLYRKLLASRTLDDPGFASLWGFYLGSQSPRATGIIERIQDLGERRLRDMDETGIDVQILSLTSPGVQVFDAATAGAVARDANDELAAAIARHPDRFSRARRRRAAGRRGRREGDRARRAAAGAQGSDPQLAHAGRVSRSPEVLADLRGLRGARRTRLPAPEHPIEGDDRALRRGRARRRHLRFRRRDRAAPASDHRRLACSTASPDFGSSSAIAARRCRSGSSGSTTCIARRSRPGVIRS